MKRFVSLVLSVCFLFSINTVSYAANTSSRKASNPVIQSMNDKYHVDFSGMSIDELNKFIDKMKDEDQTRASGNLLNNTQLAWLAAAQIARDKGYECAALMVEFGVEDSILVRHLCGNRDSCRTDDPHGLIPYLHLHPCGELMHTAVDDGFLHRQQPFLAAHHQFAQRKDKVSFQGKRVIFLGVVGIDVHHPAFGEPRAKSWFVLF